MIIIGSIGYNNIELYCNNLKLIVTGIDAKIVNTDVKIFKN